MKTKLTGFLLPPPDLGGGVQKQLKKPASTGDDKSAAAPLSEDHVRQMAQVFAQEFAAELKRQNGRWPM